MTIILAFAALLATSILIAAVMAVPVGALVMLLLGAAHSYDERIPAFGFAASYFLTLAVAVATSKTTTKSE